MARPLAQNLLPRQASLDVRDTRDGAARTAASPSAFRIEFSAIDYDLAATLVSGQAFRWQELDGWWHGVVGARWVRLRAEKDRIVAEVAEPASDWRWLAGYLQVDQNLTDVLLAFPDDEPMRAAVAACRGLRLLRQDPWECLASFICSSTKQIVQIRQIVALLCERFGEHLPVPAEVQPAFSFPSVERLATAAESELRTCKMGFRAPYLLATAQSVVAGDIDLVRLGSLQVSEARARLVELPGVGRKVADCVLLFAYGFQEAFPVDVWVQRALRRLYFPGRRVSPRRLQEFTATHFGAWSGYAQQYLFHYMRVHARRPA